MRQRQEALTGVQKMKPSGYFRGFGNIWDFMGLGVVHTVGNSKWNETFVSSSVSPAPRTGPVHREGAALGACVLSEWTPPLRVASFFADIGSPDPQLCHPAQEKNNRAAKKV